MKKILTYIILLIEIVLDVIMIVASIGTGASEYGETGIFDEVYLVFLLISAACMAITIAGWIRFMRYDRKWIVLPGLGMKVVAIAVGLISFFLDGIQMGALPVGTMILLCVLGICKMKKKGKVWSEDPKRKQSQQIPAATRFDIYKAKWAWDDAAAEYCQLYQMSLETLTDRERDQIFIYGTNYIAYLFVWLVKRDLVGPQLMEHAGLDTLYNIRQEKINPAEWLYFSMDGTLSRDDVKEKILSFLDSYYPGTYFENATSKKNVCYEKDYEEIVIAGGNQVWCREFSWEISRRMEERLDLRYHYHKVWKEFEEFEWTEESDRIFFSEALGQNFQVVAADGVQEEYIQRCIEHCRYLTDSVLWYICRKIDELWAPTDQEHYTPEQLKQDISAGSLVIPVPYGKDVVYVLCCEAEFEPEHGISIPIRQEIVLDLGYGSDWETPWSYEMEQAYQKALKENGRI